MPPVQAYTVEQVAEMLNISRDKVYYLLRTRQLRSIKIGKSAASPTPT
jgi:excisionase family DNA binding protein